MSTAPHGKHPVLGDSRAHVQQQQNIYGGCLDTCSASFKRCQYLLSPSGLRMLRWVANTCRRKDFPIFINHACSDALRTPIYSNHIPRSHSCYKLTYLFGMSAVCVRMRKKHRFLFNPTLQSKHNCEWNSLATSVNQTY